MESVDHVRAVLDTVGEGIITIDNEEVIRMMNAEAERIFGVERGEYVGRHVHVLMPERYRKLHSDAFFRYIGRGPSSGINQHVEVEGLRKDGSEFPVELRFTTVVVEGQRLFTAAARDITIRKQRNKRLDSTIALLQERVRAEDLLTRISSRFINSPVAQIGPGIDEALAELGRLVGVDRSFIVIVPALPELRPGVLDLRRLVTMAHEWCAEGVEPMLGADGQLDIRPAVSGDEVEADGWFRDRILSGETVRVDCVDSLPPELAPLRARLADWHVRSRIAVPIVSEGVATGIFGFDCTRQERSWDDAVEQLMRLSGPIFANAILRKRSAEALHRANAELEQKVEERTRQLREKQAQLVQSEKLASLGQLVAGVAHEINTPLGALGSNNDTTMRALSRARDLLDDPALAEIKPALRARKLLDGVEGLNRVSADAIERITTLVRSLRSFARLDQAELAEVDLHDGLDSTLALLHHELKNRIKVVRDYGELPNVSCYANQINQVFMNLLVNAVQAIEGKGRISVTTRPAGDAVTVRIEDTGRGIAARDLSRIFDPGFTTKGVGVGTGLGLSIVHQILQQHGADIDVHSQPGEGTRVTVSLPVKQR
ncbi:MAG: ATP-binding protein [Myxococcales bacterium]|jgi:PAS domain S-box-containing protein